MKIIFFGLGSIGTKHAEIIKNNFKHQLFVYSNKKNKLNIPLIRNKDELIKIKPDIAFITTPTNKHIEPAIMCAKEGINLFIEKPLSHNLLKVGELLKEINKQNINAYTAYCLRFHPVIKWLKSYLKNTKPIHVMIYASSYLPDWRKKQKDHLNNFRANKSTGGGVILDLSHEIDYTSFLFGKIKDIKINSSKISNVTNDSEDFADILIKTNDEIYCNIHINFMSHLLKREIIIDFIDKTIIADVINNQIKIIKDNKEKIIKIKNKKNQMYIEQIKYFLKNINNKKMQKKFKESIDIFKTIIKIKKKVIK